MKSSEGKKMSLTGEFSSITISKVGDEIILVFNGDEKLYRRLQKACHKRGIYFTFSLSRCG